MLLRPFALVSAALLSLAAPSSPSAARSVLVVDDDAGPGVDFTDLQAAIDAAAAGDTLLLEDGVYASVGDTFLIDGKGLRLIANEGAAPTLRTSLRIQGVDAGSVVLRGLQVVDGASPFASASLTVSDCSAVVWIEDCLVDATGINPLGGPDPNGLRVVDCDRVVVLRSSLTGSSLTDVVEGAGLYATGSTLHVYDTTAVGGNVQADGAAGLLLEGSTAFVSGGTFQGGQGTDAPVPTFCAGDGGDGIRLTGTDPSVTLLDVETVPGQPGFELCGTAVPGESIVVESGSATTLDGEARRYVTDSVAVSGGTVTHTWTGEPGDVVVLVLAGSPDTISLAGVTGTLLLGGPFAVLPLGATPTGSLELTLSVPPIGALPRLPVFLQGAFLDGAQAFLATGSTQTILP